GSRSSRGLSHGSRSSRGLSHGGLSHGGLSHRSPATHDGPRVAEGHAADPTHHNPKRQVPSSTLVRWAVASTTTVPTTKRRSAVRIGLGRANVRCGTTPKPRA